MAHSKLQSIITPPMNPNEEEPIPGWGSAVQIRFTSDGQEVQRVAEPEDFAKAAHYLNFLTAQKQIEVDIQQEVPDFDITTSVHGMFLSEKQQEQQMKEDMRTQQELLWLVNLGMVNVDTGVTTAFSRDEYIALKVQLEALKPEKATYQSDLKHLKC